jgi:hypothetical protein
MSVNVSRQRLALVMWLTLQHVNICEKLFDTRTVSDRAAVGKKNAILLDVTPYSLVDIYHRF